MEYFSKLKVNEMHVDPLSEMSLELIIYENIQISKTIQGSYTSVDQNFMTF